MNYDQVIESEEDEAAFAELVEYVRMAVVFIYQEHHESDPAHDPKCHGFLPPPSVL